MANWKKLRNEYSVAINALTREDWAFWEKTRIARKNMRRQELDIRAKIHAEKLRMRETSGDVLLSQTVTSMEPSALELTSGVSFAGENTYPMAA